MIKTKRLVLVPGTPEFFAAPVDDRETLARLLGARVPAEWPPELYDQSGADWTARYLAENPDAVGWAFYYVLLGSDEGDPVVVGGCGFKGKPAADGAVEIGYGLLPEFQGAGVGTEAAGGLIAWAFAHPEVTRVAAETYPELKASIRVMEKNGLRFAGRGSEERVIRYELTRADWERRRGSR